MRLHLATAHVGAIAAAGLILLPGHLLPEPGGLAAASASPAVGPAPTASPGTGPTASASPRASAVPVAAARLSISITDGRTAVKPGDTLTYQVRVWNSGTSGAPHLKITQALPAGLKFVSASGQGVVASGQVVWLTGIPAGGADTFRVVTQVTGTPASELRLAAVACAEPQGSKVPTVCAAHLDALPAVAGAATAPQSRAAASSGPTALEYAGIALAVVVLAALGVLFGLRRRGRETPGERPG